MVFSLTVYLAVSGTFGPSQPDSSPLTTIDWTAGVSVSPGDSVTLPWLDTQLSY